MTDSTKSFSTLSSMMVESPAFAAAAAALASIVVMKTDEFHVLLADELYIFARRTLRGLESEHHGERLLATTLLCKYCSALGKTVEEQSTLYECAEILESHSLQDAPHRVLTACFWVFARQGTAFCHLCKQILTINRYLGKLSTWTAYNYSNR